MCHLKRMIDVFSNLDTIGGIFTALETLSVPWAGASLSIWLDIAYHTGHAGEKPISPLVSSTLGNADSLTESMILRLANVIYSLYSVQWAKEYATRSAQYNPIENYSMTEQMSNDNRNTVKTGTKATTAESEADNSQNGTGTNTIYGFNSTQGAPADQTTNTDTMHSEQSASGSETDNETVTDTHSYMLTRSGNIGVTTSQQMLESERSLWRWSFFQDVVFPDIDKILTLAIY